MHDTGFTKRKNHMIARTHGQKGRMPFYIDHVIMNIYTFQASKLLITDLIHIKVHLEVGIQQMEFDSKWLFWFNLSPKDQNKLFATKIGSTNLRKKRVIWF